MAETQEVKNINNTTKAKPAAVPEASIPAGFVKVGIERNMFKNDPSNALQGLLLGLVELPNKGNKPGKDGRLVWDAFIVRLTAPCTVLDKDKKESKAGIGDEVIVPANFKLKQTFASQANRADVLFEVYVRPTKKVDIGGGQSLQLFDTAVSPTVHKRDGSNILMGSQLVAPEVRTSPALGMGGGDVTEDDIGF